MRPLLMLWIFWVGCIMLSPDGVASDRVGYPNAQFLIETQKLAARLGNEPELRILDARDPEIYREGHLDGAVNLPAATTDYLEANRQGFPIPTAWAQRLLRATGINASSRVVIYDEQGNTLAARIFYFLEFFGHSHVQILNGGLKKWRMAGRPITVDVPRVPDGDFIPVPNPTLVATSEWILKHLPPQVVIIDARSPAEYRGERAIGPRGGHIPGAVNIPWDRVLGPGNDQIFLPAGSLRQVFAESHLTPARQVVVYCQFGTRGAEIYFALRLMGYRQVRLYDGGWEDWSADTKLPVEK